MQEPNPRLTPEQLEAQAEADYRWLIDDQRGRRIARAFLRWSGIDDTGPTQGAEAMALATGARMVGNLLRAHLRKYHPEGWVRMESEHTHELVFLARQEDERQEAVRREARKHMDQGTP